jgi:hypothetical protein
MAVDFATTKNHQWWKEENEKGRERGEGKGEKNEKGERRIERGEGGRIEGRGE